MFKQTMTSNDKQTNKQTKYDIDLFEQQLLCCRGNLSKQHRTKRRFLRGCWWRRSVRADAHCLRGSSWHSCLSLCWAGTTPGTHCAIPSLGFWVKKRSKRWSFVLRWQLVTYKYRNHAIVLSAIKSLRVKGGSLCIDKLVFDAASHL